MEKKQAAKSKLTFESALAELETIARVLEDGSQGLEESIAEFEKGIRLAKFCHLKLEEAERKIEILQKGADGEIAAKNVKIKDDTGELEEDEDMQGSLL